MSAYKPRNEHSTDSDQTESSDDSSSYDSDTSTQKAQILDLFLYTQENVQDETLNNANTSAITAEDRQKCEQFRKSLELESKKTAAKLEPIEPDKRDYPKVAILRTVFGKNKHKNVKIPNNPHPKNSVLHPLRSIFCCGKNNSPKCPKSEPEKDEVTAIYGFKISMVCEDGETGEKIPEKTIYLPVTVLEEILPGSTVKLSQEFEKPENNQEDNKHLHLPK